MTDIDGTGDEPRGERHIRAALRAMNKTALLGDCYSEEELSAFLDHRANANRGKSILAHLSTCFTCQDVLLRLHEDTVAVIQGLIPSNLSVAGEQSPEREAGTADRFSMAAESESDYLVYKDIPPADEPNRRESE